MKKKPAKKKPAHLNAPAADAPQDSGAPAALKAIESDELLCRKRRDAAMKEWEEKDRKLVLGDDVSEADERRAWMRYQEAREVHAETLKSLATFDKGVREDRREGEKVLVADAKEWFAQMKLCWHIALENYLVGMSQRSPTFKAPVDFMKAHGDLIRATEESAIAAAVKEKQLPAWIL